MTQAPRRRQTLATRMSRNRPENQPVEATMLDEALMHEQFRREALPRILEAIRRGDNLEKMFSDNETALAARLMTIALSDPDAKVALQAMKEITDRAIGKSKDSVSIEHKYEKMSDVELDSLLASKLRKVRGE